MLKRFPWWLEWVVPHLNASQILLVVLIQRRSRHAGHHLTMWRGDAGQSSHNLTPWGKGNIACPYGEKGVWLSLMSRRGVAWPQVGREERGMVQPHPGEKQGMVWSWGGRRGGRHGTTPIQMWGQRAWPGCDQECGAWSLGIWWERVTTLIANDPLLPNFPPHGEACRPDVMAPWAMDLAHRPEVQHP